MFLFHNFRHHKKPVGLCGRVAQGVVVRERRANLVRTRDIDQRHGVGGWLDTGNVQFLQLLDVAEDAVELCAEFLFLVGGEMQPRQMRDVFDVNFSGSHSERLKFGA